VVTAATVSSGGVWKTPKPRYSPWSLIPLCFRPAGLALERLQDVVHVVPVIDAIQAEEERVELGVELGAAILVPAERLALVAQVAGKGSMSYAV
jgi:hypothetical protein